MSGDFGGSRAGLRCASVAQAGGHRAGQAHRVGADVPLRHDHRGDTHILGVKAEEAGAWRFHAGSAEAMRLSGARKRQPNASTVAVARRWPEPRDPAPDGGARRDLSASVTSSRRRRR
jgi:hypothetical protein